MEWYARKLVPGGRQLLGVPYFGGLLVMERRRPRRTFAFGRRSAWALLASVLGLWQLVLPRPATATSLGCPPWTVVRSVNTSNSAALGPSGTSSSDVWAVGEYFDSRAPYTMHWDGTRWHRVAQAAPAGVLIDSVAIDTNDVWAVGYVGVGLITEHWDGSVWTIVPAPSPMPGARLYSVDAASSTDVWAVGYYNAADGKLVGLTEHWDGTSWTVVPDAPTLGEVFYSVSVISSTDVWAAGFQGTPSADEPVAEHWDGTSWSVIPTAFPSGDENQFLSISASATNDVWATGFHGPFGTEHPLAEHWDGTTFTIVSAPNGPGDASSFQGVAAISPDDAWVVGQSQRFATGSFKPLTEHWDGTAWTLVPAPFPGTSGRLFAVGAVDATNVWAAGDFTDSTGQLRPLTERSAGCPS